MAYDIEKKRAAGRRWYQAHKDDEKMKAHKRDYRKKYYLEHRQEELDKRKEYQKANPEKVKEWAKISRQRRKIKGLFKE